MGRYREAEEKPRRGMWPVYGLLMAVAAAGIAYVLAPEALILVRRQSPQFNIGTFTDQQVELLFGGVIFMVLILIIALILAAFVPRQRGPNTINDKIMAKEKQRMEAERKERRKRQLALEKKMRQENKRLQ